MDKKQVIKELGNIRRKVAEFHTVTYANTSIKEQLDFFLARITSLEHDIQEDIHGDIQFAQLQLQTKLEAKQKEKGGKK